LEFPKNARGRVLLLPPRLSLKALLDGRFVPIALALALVAMCVLTETRVGR
jgi:hypothetical protein